MSASSFLAQNLSNLGLCQNHLLAYWLAAVAPRALPAGELASSQCDAWSPDRLLRSLAGALSLGCPWLPLLPALREGLAWRKPGDARLLSLCFQSVAQTLTSPLPLPPASLPLTSLPQAVSPYLHSWPWLLRAGPQSPLRRAVSLPSRGPSPEHCAAPALRGAVPCVQIRVCRILCLQSCEQDSPTSHCSQRCWAQGALRTRGRKDNERPGWWGSATRSRESVLSRGVCV